MTIFDRLREAWRSPAMRAAIRLLGMFARGVLRLARSLAWQLRIAWWQISPRGRIFVTIFGLVLLSAWTAGAAPSVSATAQALAVLMLAFVGLWIILTSPFRSRRW